MFRFLNNLVSIQSASKVAVVSTDFVISKNMTRPLGAQVQVYANQALLLLSTSFEQIPNDWAAMFASKFDSWNSVAYLSSHFSLGSEGFDLTTPV